MLSKIAAARGKAVDGHAPGVSGPGLSAYVAAGVGSDHETVSLKEGREKLRLGMHLMIREGSSEKNLEELLPLVTDETYKRCLFVVDDRSCADLKRDGDIDAVVRKAIRLGLSPVRAIQLATVNTAEYFKLDGVGAVAPGYHANLLVIDDLDKLNINMVFYRGKQVAEGGKPLFEAGQAASPPDSTVNVKPFTMDDIKTKADNPEMPVIEVVPGQIVTRRIDEKLEAEGGYLVPDVSRDILKLVVVERHKATGNIGKGFIKGFGLKKGALASSVAHDSHNIIAVGCTDEDIMAAVNEVARLNGGLSVVADGKVLSSLALPIGGLMSPQPLDSMVARFEALVAEAHKLGTGLPAPFATLSFMALPVIPELRLTDLGLVDVNSFKLIS
jgi:adenine deaminase